MNVNETSMPITRNELNELFLATRDRTANEQEYQKFKDREYDQVFSELDTPFKSPGFVNAIFQANMGRDATPRELEIYQSAPPSRFIDDVKNSPETIEFQAFKDVQTFEQFNETQRPLIEAEFGDFYNEQIKELEEDVRRRIAITGEDKQTAISRTLEDKQVQLDRLARAERQLAEDKGVADQRIQQNRQFFEEDRDRSLAAFDRNIGQARENREATLNQRGLLQSEAFDQGGVAGALRQRSEADIADQQARLNTNIQKQEQGFQQQQDDLQRRFKRGAENLQESTTDLNRSVDRRLKDVNLQADRKTFELDDFLTKKKDAIEEQKKRDIATTTLNRFNQSQF